jgi:DNA-binding beta-propeller fold protein YncE
MPSKVAATLCTTLVGSMVVTAAPQSPSPAPVPIATRASATLTIPGSADFLVADGRAVWVTNEGRVERLALGQAAPVASVALASPCGAMVTAFGSLWVADCKEGGLVRVDLRTHRVTARVATGLADPDGELSLAAGAGSIWVLTDRKGVLSRIDPATNRVVATIAVAPESFCAAFAFGAVWITNTRSAIPAAGGSVQRIDPAANRVIATIGVGPTPRFLAAGEGGVWTLNQGDGTVSRIDPATNIQAASIPAHMAGSGGDIAAGAGRIWVRGKTILLATIDPATNRVAEVFGPPAGSGAVRVAGDLVWITAHDIRTVWVLRARPAVGPEPTR